MRIGCEQHESFGLSQERECLDVGQAHKFDCLHLTSGSIDTNREHSGLSLNEYKD